MARLYRIVILGALLLVATAMTACGQKGPLFLPAKLKPVVVNPPAVSPASDPSAVTKTVSPPTPAVNTPADIPYRP